MPSSPPCVKSNSLGLRLPKLLPACLLHFDFIFLIPRADKTVILLTIDAGKEFIDIIDNATHAKQNIYHLTTIASSKNNNQ
jgi:hypothetical protein